MAILAIPDQVICLAWRQKLLRNVAGNVADSYAFGALYRRSVDAEHPDDATEHINALEAFVGNLADIRPIVKNRMPTPGIPCDTINIIVHGLCLCHT